MTALILAILACGGGGPPGDGPKGPGASAEALQPVTVVEVRAASRGSVSDVLVASAVVESEASADLVPEATGVVREIRRDEGDAVEAGDVLAILDNVTLGTGAQRATAEVQRLEQQLEEARGLLARGAISTREVEDLEYQLESARLSSREARRSFGSTRITAPFDGVVAMRDVQEGELATSAKPAFQVVDPERLRVVASIPERDLGRVAVDQPVRLVSAYDPDVWTTGRVERLSPVVDPGSGTFRVTVNVEEPRRLRPGQFVSVQIEVDRKSDVLVVPKQAVVYEDGVPVVYRMIDAPPEDEAQDEADEAPSDEDDAGWLASWFGGGDDEETDGTEPSSPDEDVADEDADHEPERVAERVYVELGLADEDHAQILEGVELGDAIIVIGQSHLRDGGRVRVAGEGQEAQAGRAEDDAG